MTEKLKKQVKMCPEELAEENAYHADESGAKEDASDTESDVSDAYYPSADSTVTFSDDEYQRMQAEERSRKEVNTDNTPTQCESDEDSDNVQY